MEKTLDKLWDELWEETRDIALFINGHFIFQESKEACITKTCEGCWNREMPETKEKKKVEIKEVKRVAELGEYVKYLNNEYFKKGEILECVKDDYGDYNLFTNGKCTWYLNRNSYIVLEGYDPEKTEELTASPWDAAPKCGMLESEHQEMVDHPQHYNTGKREVIEEMRILFGDEQVAAFCKLNAYKYLRRADYKGKKEEDLKKAEWYIDYAAKLGGEK